MQRRADDVFNALLAGRLSIAIASRHTLDDVHEVHERIENRTQIGKAVMYLD